MNTSSSACLFSYAEGELAIVTGGSRGIGRAISLELARCGFDICFTYRKSTAEAEQLVSEVQQLGRKCVALRFDVRDRQQVENALQPVVEKRPVFVLVNNAGVTRDTLLAWMSTEEWDDVIRTTLDGFFNVTKTVLPRMMTRRTGRIVNVASVTGQAGRAGQVNYAAAKAGLIGATKALAAEVAKRGVLVNAVAPGFVDTDMIGNLPVAEIIASIPLQRIARPAEVASLVAYLCSEQATYVTGQILGINGGVYG